MPPNKRYSSCDACHRSRIGCNASSQAGRPCHNCVRRGKACTFTRAQAGRSLPSRQHPAQLNKSTATELQSASKALSYTQEATRLHDVLYDIFAKRLEPRIGLWISAECCPFFLPTGTTTTLISKLMVALDAACGPENTCSGEYEKFESISRCSINRSLMSAVYAYSVRWIFLEDLSRAQDEPSRDKVRRVRQDLAANLWTQAQRWLPAALSTPCYRSILALHLLGNAPETGVKERHGVGTACLQASLNHFVYLRSRRRRMSVQTNPFSALTPPKVISRMDPTKEPPPARLTQYEFGAMEDLAYWFGAIADTSRAVLQYSPSILFPGNSGDEKVWSTVRRKIVGFDETHRQLHEGRAPLSDEQVVEILQNAFSSKMYCWAAIARVQDSVLHNTTSTPLAESLNMIQCANNQFEDIFTHLLDLCRRDFMLLSPTVQMSYTLVNIHFQVGSLILADIIDEPPIFHDSGARPFNLRICACRSIVNAVSVALQADKKANNSTAQSILLLDPYPEYIIDALIRTGSSLVLLHNQQYLKLDAVRTMFHPVFSALEVLSDISYTAMDALPLLRDKLAIIDLPQSKNHTAVFDHTVCNGKLLEELEHQVATDPCLITKSIERTESDVFLSSILDADFDNIDFDALAADYSFEALSDSFSSPEKAIIS